MSSEFWRECPWLFTDEDVKEALIADTPCQIDLTECRQDQCPIAQQEKAIEHATRVRHGQMLNITKLIWGSKDLWNAMAEMYTELKQENKELRKRVEKFEKHYHVVDDKGTESSNPIMCERPF